MSKKSKKPSYSTGIVTVNGRTVATSKKTKEGIESSYNMTDAEKAIYDGIQSNLSSSLAGLYEISDEKQKQWKKEMDTYKKTGIEEINNIYTPMINDLRDNIATRFGNLDNSVFMDNLNTITNKQAKAVSEFSDDLIMKERELYTEEISNRLNYISLLSGLNEAMDSSMMNYMQMSNANSSSGNSYNQANASGGSSFGSLFGSALSSASKIGSSVLSFLKK